MRIRIEIDPNDVVREAQRQHVTDFPYKKATEILRSHQQFIEDKMNKLKSTLVRDVFEFSRLGKNSAHS